MKYAIEFTETAGADLREIALYIAETTSNKEIAKAFVKELADQCSGLEDFPFSGAVPKDRFIVSMGYRFLVYKDYLIFYTVNELNAKVYVHTVFNGKKDYTRVMKKLI